VFFKGDFSAVIRENRAVIGNCPAVIRPLNFLFPSSFTLILQTAFLTERLLVFANFKSLLLANKVKALVC
jgi:hypothetical protein